MTSPSTPGGVLVLGASGGIGSALARRLHAAGRPMFLAARREEPLAALAQELGAPYACADARDGAQVAALFERARASLGGLTGAVNAVGSILLKPAARTSDEEFQAVIDQNLKSAFHCLREAARIFEAGGSLVLMSSAAARFGLANHEAIAAAKAGVIGLTLSAAATYAPRNIRVNCVAPGLVDTPLAARITANPAALQASTAMHALGRIGRPEDVASAIAWLLNPENSWVTGQVLGVDGGLASLKPR